MKSMPSNYFTSCHPTIHFFFLKTPICKNTYFISNLAVNDFIRPTDLKNPENNINDGDFIPASPPACLSFVHDVHFWIFARHKSDLLSQGKKKRRLNS